MSTLLDTITSISINASDIDIYTYYNDNVSNTILSVFVATDSGTLNGVPYEEGDLVANITSSTNMYLDADGELTIDALEASNYSLDSDTGSLIFTE